MEQKSLHWHLKYRKAGVPSPQAADQHQAVACQEPSRRSKRSSVHAHVGSRQCTKSWCAPPRSTEKPPSMEPVPSAQKVGGRCSKECNTLKRMNTGYGCRKCILKYPQLACYKVGHITGDLWERLIWDLNGTHKVTWKLELHIPENVFQLNFEMLFKDSSIQ